MPPVTASTDHAPRLARAVQVLGLTLDTVQQAALLAYVGQMQHWNRTYNLTALRDPEQMLIQHVFDSLSLVGPLARVLDARGDAQAGARLMDVGSGGGLPGVVLAIARPDWQVTCVDAVEKKTAFVRQMAGVLKLPNLKATHSRVEQIEPAQCDAVVSRAFASLADFSRLAGRHVAEDGWLVGMKGREPDDEAQALQEDNAWDITRVEPLTVPELQAQRCIVWMRRKGNP